MKRAWAGLVTGLTLSLLLTFLAGENPWHVLQVFAQSAFGSRYDFGQVVFYSTSLMFTGLSVCLAFHAGLFNIGAEGQLTMGALTMAAVGVIFPNAPVGLAPLFATLAGLVAAGFWGWVPAVLRTRFGSHEVITTMMMNFVAAGLASFVMIHLQNPESQNPETATIGPHYQITGWDPIHALWPESMANFSLILALLTALGLWIFLNFTPSGFEVKAAGANEEVASTAGISYKKKQLLALTVAGAIAGLVGWNEILGSAGKYRMGFSPDYGFMGIAVALLAQSNPLVIILTAFLFGSLQKGATDLDLETAHITRDFAKVLEAVIILSVVALQSKALFKWRKSK